MPAFFAAWHASAVRDFYDDEEVMRVYYREAEQLLKQVTGADRIHIFDHTVRRRVPGTSEALAGDVAEALRRLRTSDVQKPPGIAEAIDWVAALELIGAGRLDAAAAERTLGSVLKYREDQELVRERGTDWLVEGRNA